MRPMIATLVTALASLLVAAAPVRAQEQVGPPGVASNKVLVIGTDGTNWHTLAQLMADGRAPSFARLARSGFATATSLAYAPPDAFTVSQVGWSTIATGVWPAKHGVRDLSNRSPGQATKNGYDDFLTRVERARPQLSTMLVSDWENIGTPAAGGPIFGSADTRRTVAAGDYDAQDEAGTAFAAEQLRGKGPDASFVYLGVVDVVGHDHGPSSPEYVDAIVRTDARVGRLLDAIEARRTRSRETWTILVTTDHGQIDLLGLGFHGGPTSAERTSFVVASGPGLASSAGPGDARVVDIAPTVLHQLGLPTRAPADLDGRSLSTAPPPPPPGTPVARCRRTAGTVVCDVRRGDRAPLLRTVRVSVGRRARTVRARGAGRSALRVVLPVARAQGVRRVSLRAVDAAGFATRLRVRVARRPGRR